MPYKIGISTGFWSIGKDPALLGLAQKAGGLGATGGIRFTQLDLETISEFVEPNLKENMKRMQKELGLEVGLHGEIGQLAAFESAERRIWEQAHNRLVETVKKSADLGFKYINYHFSTTIIVQQEESRIRPFGYSYHVVTPWGEPFPALCEKSNAAKDYVMRLLDARGGMASQIAREEPYQKMIKEEEDKLRKEIEKIIEEEKDPARRNALVQEAQRRVREKVESPNFLYDAWKKSPYSRYVLEGGEIDAYMIVAHYMKEQGDPLWTQIVGSERPEEAYNTKPKEFNAAVAARYIEGHIKEKKNKDLEESTVKDFIKDKEIYVLFENPEAGQGHEGLYRLYDPLQGYHLIKKIGSPYVKMTIDFEHMLTQRIDPNDFVKKAPSDFGKYIKLFHLGEPKPYHPAHIPIPLGSQAQEILYKWIYELRKKGFTDGYMIFERGGGRTGGGKTPFEVFEHSVWVLRQIAKFLEQDTEPGNLPPEFFGMSFDNKDVYSRQLVTIREHAWDPLHDVLSVPEEKHTFLSRAAVEKGKAQEWERRKFR